MAASTFSKFFTTSSTRSVTSFLSRKKASAKERRNWRETGLAAASAIAGCSRTLPSTPCRTAANARCMADI